MHVLCFQSLAFCEEKQVQSWLSMINYTADKINFSGQDNLVVGEGNVSIKHGGITLEADKVTVDLEKKQAVAEGNAKVIEGTRVISGTKILYDFTTKKTTFESIHLEATPWFIFADSVERDLEGVISIHDTSCSTCDYAQPHWRFETKELVIYPKDRIVAKDVVAYIGKIPVFYWPQYTHSLKNKKGKSFFVPGRSSQWGPYFLSGYRYQCGDDHHGTFRLDYRQKKGWGYGVDHEYLSKQWEWLLRAYMVNGEKVNDLTDDDRYRLKWVGRFQNSPNLWSVIEWNKLSDRNIIKDYIQKEYETNPEPESYTYVQYDMDNAAASFLIKRSVNAFFDEIEYIPQVKYDSNYVSIKDLPLYWKTDIECASLKRKDQLGEQSETNRVNFNLNLSYGKKYGIFSFNPYVGVSQTYYTHLLDGEESGFRGAFSGGVKLSTKFHKKWDVKNELFDIEGLRVIHEPMLSYRYRSSPTLSTEKIRVFDTTDELCQENFFEVRWESRLQKRQTREDENVIKSLLEYRVYTEYHPEGTGLESEDFSDVFQEWEFYPTDSFGLYLDTAFDTYDNCFTKVEADFSFRNKKEDFRLQLGHHYLLGTNDKLVTEVEFSLFDQITCLLRNDYDFIEDYFSREEYTFFKDLHCWRLAFTYAKKKDKEGSEDEFWITCQLKAFQEDAYDFTDAIQGFLKS